MPEAKYYVTVRRDPIPVAIEENNGTVTARVGERAYQIDLRHVTKTPIWSLLIDGRVHKAILVQTNGEHLLHLDGQSQPVTIGTERDQILRQFAPAGGAAGGVEIVKAPMPGLVVQVHVKVGDTLAEGQSVATVEAMKMQNEFKTKHAGKVTKVQVKAGDSVAKGAPLVTVEAGADAEGA